MDRHVNNIVSKYQLLLLIAWALPLKMDWDMFLGILLVISHYSIK